jgi:serine phosphatase RsbU (regulator of sigma subunit)
LTSSHNFLVGPVSPEYRIEETPSFIKKPDEGIVCRKTVTAVSQVLTSLLNLDEVIRQVIYTVRKEMFIDTAGVVLLETKKRSCQTLFIGNNDDHKNPTSIKDQTSNVCIDYDDPLLALLSKEKKLITRYDLAEDPRYVDMREACGQRFTEMGASLAIPMVYQDELKGALVLGHKKSGHFYTREDIDLLTTLTSQGAVAIENARLFEENLEKGRMEEELKIAHDIQTSMLPDRAPEVEGFKIAGSSLPAKEVGGDFYDFIEIRRDKGGDRLAIVIGDVSGKGVSGALMMAAARSTCRVLSEGHSSVEELMTVGNRRLNSDIKKGMFVALIYAEIDSVGKTLTFSNAGQTQPIICSRDSSGASYIETEGDRFPLGILKESEYQERLVQLREGDTIVFYTDGVVEAMNAKGELYGFERFMSAVEEGKHLGAQPLMNKLMDDVSRYMGDVEQHDDITIVVVKVE